MQFEQLILQTGVLLNILIVFLRPLIKSEKVGLDTKIIDIRNLLNKCKLLDKTPEYGKNKEIIGSIIFNNLTVVRIIVNFTKIDVHKFIYKFQRAVVSQ